MIDRREFGTVSHPEEAETLGAMLLQCFNVNGWEKYRDRIGVENFRILRQGNQILGGLAIYQMGQWWGGECVPMAGIAAVGVSPESRGMGVARELLSQTLQELRANKVPLSTLYAATQYLYRKVGYEQGGNFCQWEIETQKIGISDRTLTMQRVESLDAEAFNKIYRQQASVSNGNLDRPPAIWQDILNSTPETPLYAYLVGTADRPEGYIIYTQQGQEENLKIKIADWVALTPSAARRLWTFLADSRSQVHKATWCSSPVDPMLLLIPEQTAKISILERWLLRIVDVSLALEKRGYPSSVNVELHLDITDDILPENNGNFLLKVSGGKGEVTPGGRGDLRLDINALATLYSGLFTPDRLQLAGKIEGDADALNMATVIFAGAQPWLPDFF